MIDFKTFCQAFAASSKLRLAVLPIAVLILVNGLTDAPVNIATAVNSRAISPKRAVFMSALCNFGGAMASGGAVAYSLYSLSGLALVGESALPALTASAVSVSAWALFALFLGIPTSESHALSAALTGAAVSVADLSVINGSEWAKVLLGLVLSTFPVAAVSCCTAVFFKKAVTLGGCQYKKLQIFSSALSSFAHGSQDGQKFAGALALSVAFCADGTGETEKVPLWCVGLSAMLISVGTLIGGRKILNTFKSFAPATADLGFAADLVSALSLCVLAFFGIPAATTQAKTSAVFGAGRAAGKSLRSQKTLLGMIAVWVLTFPVCAVLGYVITKLLIMTKIF